MPDILIDLRRPASDGVDVGTVGAVECVPTSRREVDGAIVLPSPFAARLVDGAVTVDLAETGLDWCWRITERVRDGITRYVTVPASEVTLDYADLADVDPDTLDPTAEPEAAWTIALAALETTDLADVAATTPTDGQVLAWDAGAGHYAPSTAAAGGASALDDLTDVSTAGQAAGEALVSNGTTWAPSAAAVILEGDSRLADARTPTSHGHAASEVTSGTLDIARIPTGQTGTTVPLGNDARFSDARTPTAHTHTLSDVTNSGGAAALNVGTTAGTVAAGDHAHAGYAAASHEHTAADIDSGAATDGHVLTSDGAGGAAWEAPAGGGGSVATDAIFDAKGDLPVGTGADTASRLAAGANGTALTADSAAATGLRWATPGGLVSPGVRPIVGRWYIGSDSNLTAGKAAPTDIAATPFMVPEDITIDRLGCQITTAQAGVTVRLGIYNARSSDGLMGTVLLDGGTVDASTTGAKEVTVSQQLKANTLYWAAHTASGSGVQGWGLVGNYTGFDLGRTSIDTPGRAATAAGSSGTLIDLTAAGITIQTANYVQVAYRIGALG